MVRCMYWLVAGIAPAPPVRAGIDNVRHDGLAGNSMMTRNLTRRIAKKHKNNIQNNIQITQNNTGACSSKVEPGAAYALYLKELPPEIGSGLRKQYLR
jgi:hypothetical protein